MGPEEPPEQAGEALGEAQPPAFLAAASTSGDGPFADPQEPALYVAAIGASAGGLEALTDLFGQLSYDNMAFVVLQHQLRGTKSLLPSLLQRVTKVEVVEAEDGMPLVANRCYLVGADTQVSLHAGVLQVRALGEVEQPLLPIDALFSSLARDQGSQAVGVVLSGTGSDGSLGLVAIREAGGVCFAQAPETAKFSSMPMHAEAAGADFVLPVDALAKELHKLAGQSQKKTKLAVAHASSVVFAKLMLLIRQECNLDFTEYKRSMLERRIERRMNIKNIEHLTDYLPYLQSNKDELKALVQDLLINVTRFFRGTELFAYLRDQVFPQLLRQLPISQPLRLWSVGCSTGQEPYSLAICAAQAMQDTGEHRRVQVFASDIDEEALHTARKGRYPLASCKDLSAEVVRSYFLEQDQELVVRREIRDMVIFSRQDILFDPPFSNLQLVSCRNLLIYLQAAAQNQVLRTLHYALSAGGTLVLGEAETSGDMPDMFSLRNRHCKVYWRKQARTTPRLPATRLPRPPAASLALTHKVQSHLHSLSELIDHQVVESLGKPGVVLNANLRIVEVRGDVSRFLAVHPGGANLSLARLLPLPLQGPFMRAVESAPHEGTTEVVPCLLDGKLRAVVLTVLLVAHQLGGDRFYYVRFAESALLQNAGEEDVANPPAALPLNEQTLYAKTLEHELAHLRDSLHGALESRESVVHELTTFAEEAQSASEELQSANEELETSKEEVQSANEELIVVNEELRARMQELSSMQDELFHLLGQIDAPVLVVGADLNLRRYSEAAAVLFDLTPADIGRSIEYVKRFFEKIELQRVMETALLQESRQDVKVTHTSGKAYRLIVSCFRSAGQPADGCMLYFAPLIRSRQRRRHILRLSSQADERWKHDPQPMLIVSAKLTGIWANTAFFRHFKLVRDDFVGRSLHKGHLGHTLGASLRACLVQLVSEKTQSFGQAGHLATTQVAAAATLPADTTGAQVQVQARKFVEEETAYFHFCLAGVADAGPKKI